MEDAVRAGLDTSRTFIRMARENAALGGVTGMPGTPGSVTATMFTPCSNIASAARQIAQFVACENLHGPRKATRTTAPLQPTRDRGSGPITASPTGFWRQQPKATHPISKCQKAQETAPARSALQGITQHDAGDGSIPDAGQ
jgi:hypothetical protein